MIMNRHRSHIVIALLLLFFLHCSIAEAAYYLNGKVSTVGAYMYDKSPQPGTPFTGDIDKHIIPFASGTLMDAKADNLGERVGFASAGDTPYNRIVFVDLGQEVAVQSLTVKSHLAAWWFINGFVVSFSTDGKSFTNPIQNGGFSSDSPHQEGLFAECKLDAKGTKARFLRICFFVSAWRHTQIDEIDIRAKTLDGQAPRADNVGEEALKEIYKLQVEAPPVDEFGQYSRDDWPGKIHTEKELVERLNKEYERYQNVKIDPEKFDRFGGCKTLGIQSKATGMWRLEKLKGRWWFITPEGNPFLMIAVDGVDILGDPMAMNAVKHPQVPDLAKNYAWLPPQTGKFADCWKEMSTTWYGEGGKGIWKFSFFQANMIRAFGNETYYQKIDELMTHRLLAWGFNSLGKWTWRSNFCENLRLPYIRVEGGFMGDPWSEDLAAGIEATVKHIHEKYGNDPFFIGITIGNEEWWGNERTTAMLNSSPASASKKEFIARLIAKYKTIARFNSRCGTKLQSFDELAAMDMNPLQEKLKQDISKFIEDSSARFYSTWRKAVDQYDPGRLILGSSFVVWWLCTPEWAKGSIPYCDAMMIDDYPLSTDNILKNYVEPLAVPADKPVLLGEYSFTTTERGHLPFRSNVASHKDRGLCYKKLNEALFAHPNWVGSMWFIYCDQVLLGRNLDGSGESHNFGLVDICNLPYYDMIETMQQTNEQLYKIHAGETAP